MKQHIAICTCLWLATALPARANECRVLNVPRFDAKASPTSHANECRVLNVPRFDAKESPTWPGDLLFDVNRAGVAWLGRFDRHANYSEIRVGYDPNYLIVQVSVSDLMLWWALTNGVQWGGEIVTSDIEKWDAFEIAVDATEIGGGTIAATPSNKALRVVAASYQMNDSKVPKTYEPHLATKTYVAASGAWQLDANPKNSGHVWYHTVSQSWNSKAPNNVGGEFQNGINYFFMIPWASLGVSGEPASGSVLHMMVRMHDIDDPKDSEVMNLDPLPSKTGSQQVGPLPDTPWPETAKVDDPTSWATVVLNQAPYQPPAVTAAEMLTLNPSDVPTFRDVTIGGHSFIKDRWINGGGDPAAYAWETCMDTRFGNAVDLFVHPEGRPIHTCFFSRALFYYDIKDKIPADHAVTKAELKLYQFGGDSNQDSGDAFTPHISPVQVHRFEGAWVDKPLSDCVTWNTAPYAAENVGYGEVKPAADIGSGEWVTFDVTALVARAARRNEPLNMALYGADWRANTGKYFFSSENGSPNKPQLIITHGKATDMSKLPSKDSCSIGVASAFFPTAGTGSPATITPPTGTPALPTPGDPSQKPKSSSGCGCRVSHPSAPPTLIALGIFVVGLLVLRARRRR